MKYQSSIRTVLGLILLLGITAPVSAQGNGDFAASYAVMRDQDLEETFPFGWAAAVGFNVGGGLSLVGEVGGSYKSLDVGVTSVDLDVHTFLGGLRLGSGAGPIKPFIQALFGAGRASGGVAGVSASDTGFVIQPGVGLDFMILDNLGIRAQGDYRAIRADGETTSEFRFAGGVVIAF